MDGDLTGVVLDGRYRVIEPISEGAMGVVYRAERLKLGRIVAIKVLHDELPSELSSRKRFEIEAMAMAKLEHPHCASVVDVGVHEDKPFVVMDFVSGDNLRDIVANGPLPLPRAVEIVRQVLSGLAHAHEHGIIHRDIKPANIVLSQKAGLGDHVKILDFGLARLTAPDVPRLTTGIVVGTPAYMAPEQIRGTAIDHRADLYACGVLLFELLTGKKPFVSPKDDPVEVCSMHLKNPPPTLAAVQPGIEFGALEAIVARALAKKADERYANAVEFADELDAIPRRFAARRSAPIPVASSALATESGWAVPGDTSSPSMAVTPSGPSAAPIAVTPSGPSAAPIAGSPSEPPLAVPIAVTPSEPPPAAVPIASTGATPEPTAPPITGSSGPTAPVAGAGPAAPIAGSSGPTTAPVVGAGPAAPIAGSSGPTTAPMAGPPSMDVAAPPAAPMAWVAPAAPAAVPGAPPRGGKQPPAPFARPSLRSEPRGVGVVAPSSPPAALPIPGSGSPPGWHAGQPPTPVAPSAAPLAAPAMSPMSPSAAVDAGWTGPVSLVTAAVPPAFDAAAAIAAAEAAAQAVAQAPPPEPARRGLPADFDLSVAIPRGSATGADAKGLSPAFDLSIAIPSPTKAADQAGTGFDRGSAIPETAMPILERSGSVSGPTPTSGSSAPTGPASTDLATTANPVRATERTQLGLVAAQPRAPGPITAIPSATSNETGVAADSTIDPRPDAPNIAPSTGGATDEARAGGGAPVDVRTVGDAGPVASDAPIDVKSTVAFMGAPPSGPSPLDVPDGPRVAEPVEVSPGRELIPITRKQLKVIGASIAAVVVVAIVIGMCRGGATSESTEPAPAPPSTAPRADRSPDEERFAKIRELGEAGKTKEAIAEAVAARKAFPKDARFAYLLGKLHFDKQQWTQGLEQFRATLALDPTYRSDPDMIKTVLKAFITPADYPAQLGTFLSTDIGPPARQYLEETMRLHPRPNIRARAKAELAKIQ